MQYCWSFTCCHSLIFGSSSKCSRFQSFLYRYYFARRSSGVAQLVQLSYSRGSCTRYSDRMHVFSVTITRCSKDVYVNSFFPRTGKFWNSLPIERFPLTYDLNGFKFYQQKPFNCKLCLQPACFKLFEFLFLLNPCLVVAIQPCME